MIQRPQSLLLLAAIGIIIATLFFPFWIYEGSGQKIVMTAFSIEVIGEDGAVKSSESLLFMLILPVVAILVGFLTIFRYKNRVLQGKLCSVNNLVIGGFLALYLLWGGQKVEELITFEGQGGYQFAIYLPAAAAVLNLLAKRLINKDEKLVRSNDRLR